MNCVLFSGDSLLISADAHGTLCVWQLNEQRLLFEHRLAHRDAIHSLAAFDAQPIFLTAGDDNALKSWIFDEAQDDFRLLVDR